MREFASPGRAEHTGSILYLDVASGLQGDPATRRMPVWPSLFSAGIVMSSFKWQ